jgi:putative oligomerization/nucleic acid binding protein
MKLARLKEKGIISEDEFQQMKQDLIKKKIT